VDSKIIAVVAVIKVDVAWVDADVVIWVTDKIVVVMVAHHVADMADITMGTSVAVLEVDTAVVEAAMAALQEAVMAMDQSQEVVIIMVLLKVDGILDHLVTVHQIMDMAAATVVVMALVTTNHKAVVVDMVVHQWVVVAVAAVITKETAVEVVVVVAVPIAADKIIEAVLVHTELLSFSPPLCFVLG